MKVTFTSYDLKSTPRLSITTESSPNFKTRLNAHGRASLYLLHDGKCYTVSSSSTLQNQYLFLDGSTVQNLYRESIGVVHSEAAGNPENIDIDEILTGVLKKHEQELDQNAVRVTLHFPSKSVYPKEIAEYAAAVFSSRELLSRYGNEKRVLKQLIQKYSADSDRQPEDIVVQAVMSLAYSRMCEGHSGESWNKKQFRKWMCAFWEDDDLTALVRYCERPEVEWNSCLENMLYILLNNCPTYPTVYIPI